MKVRLLEILLLLVIAYISVLAHIPMARNDVILLDSVLEAVKDQYGATRELSERFELFSFDQILKNYDLSFDEIEFGWVDGKDDGGIDGIFLFVDEYFITEKPSAKRVRNEPLIELLVITCKHADSFKQEPVNNLLSTIPELFDLSKAEDELTASYNEDLLKVRSLFRETFIELAIKKPKLNIRFVYASRGDSTTVAENIVNKASLLVAQTKELFSELEAEFTFIGSAELLELYRTKKNFSLRLKFIENTISRANTNYIVLSRLIDFFHFITDDNKKLRKYLFESNVRDYLGDVGVNQDIETTLKEQENSRLDFWWLNNGVTILASSANVAGKEISLENIQIVNGLQTTETIYKYFTGSKEEDDTRAVMIKIIVTQDEVVRDRIIRATNNQSPVDIASLRAMDKIQRDIEQILLDNDLYYDRRKNFYKNEGKPADKIISLTYLSSCLQAICIGDLSKAATLKAKFFRNDNEYEKIFNTDWKIEIFLKAAQIQKAIDKELNTFHFFQPDLEVGAFRIHKHIISFIFTAQEIGRSEYQPYEILRVDHTKASRERIDSIWQFIVRCKADFLKAHNPTAKRLRKPHKNQQFHAFLKERLFPKK